MLQWLPWEDAAEAAGACAVAMVALRRSRRRGLRGVATWARELTLMFALYGLWQYAGDLSLGQAAGAVRRGRDIWRLERRLHLPSEASVQRLVLGHHELVRVLDIFYAQVDVPALGLCLIWLFARHRDAYPDVRNVLVLLTGASLLIQLVPVAPPRLVPGLGLVDTGHVVGPSVYPVTAAPGLDQLSSMPSLHVGWALVVAGGIVWALRSRWRWLAALYPAVTWWVVVVTGNHYWSDGIVAAALFVLAILVVGATRRARWRRRRRSESRPCPLPGRTLAEAGAG